MDKLYDFFQLHPLAEEEAIEIVALHIEGEANDWWFGRLKHERVTVYVEFTQRLVKRFDRRKLEQISIETFSDIGEEVYEEKNEDFNTDTMREEKLTPPPPPIDVLA